LASALAGGTDPSLSPEALCDLECLERQYNGTDIDKVRAFVLAMRDPGAYPGMSRRVVIARGQRFLWTLVSALEDAAEAQNGRPAKTERKGTSSSPAEAPALTPFDPALLNLPGIGPKTASRLASRGLSSPSDLLFLLPRRYDDRRKITPIAALKDGERAVTEGIVKQVRIFGRPWKQMMELTIEDNGAEVTGVWFSNRRPKGDKFVKGQLVGLSGLVTRYKNRLQIAHPVVVSNDGSSDVVGRIVPVYPEIPEVAGRTVEKAVRAAAERASEFVRDPMPEELLSRRDLLPLKDALRLVHIPPPDANNEELDEWVKGASPAHKRLIYDEFFFIRLALMIRKKENTAAPSPVLPMTEDVSSELAAHLRFAPTAAQRRVILEIASDMAKPSPMQRLLQGDVGSGKTFVAAAAIVQAARAGYQAALMAPTEILAEQHMRTLYPLFKKLGIRAVLHMGSARSSARKKNLGALEGGLAQVAVGTHALLQESVLLPKLGLAVVDEQHRFGVSQRLGLVGKGPDLTTPHLLVMTATPIPRTLALTVHGDLDASVLDELPPGRTPVTTKLWSNRDRVGALLVVEEALKRGEQAFVVCPVIEESETLDVRAAEAVFDELTQRFVAFPVGLLHGRMRPEDKDDTMDRFVQGDIRLLVATTIVEVGVDVQRATVMLIDGADRFGLAQLHQLRGRVGRSNLPSSCHLVADPKSEEAWERLSVLVRTNNGFEVAEADLAIRGPGELYGRRQAGLPGFRYGNLLRDAKVLEEAGKDVETLLSSEKDLNGPQSALLREELARRMMADDAPVGEESG
jgi:ATP-dependent DNA helicase RecG